MNLSDGPKTTIEVRAWVVREDGGEISPAEYGAFTDKLLEFVEGEGMKLYGGCVLRKGDNDSITPPWLATYTSTNPSDLTFTNEMGSTL